ncbi:hypothetical protein CSOJ01_00717 [Colletotrichum sojae]|uniref:Choice-of-anchor A domain-containing protein n=1 Tax=Colletotrichum sojae TaxID=2175907 RepID=A0A8H6JX55_9PEZI|nr:hypothetical protein CSOJ01_00717 [Colletotrichum sojae]
MSSWKGKAVATQEQYYAEYDESLAGMDGYYAGDLTNANAPSTLTGSETPTKTVLQSKSIRSEGEITLQGPIQVAGSVRSGGNVTLNGDFDVRDKVEAYGTVDINGNLVCDGKMKAYGNIHVAGYMSVGDKVKGFGKLKVTGTCEVKDLEIYGNTTINGFLKCKKMTLYGSLTLIGENSGYQVEGEEKIWGAIISREEDVDW